MEGTFLALQISAVFKCRPENRKRPTVIARNPFAFPAARGEFTPCGGTRKALGISAGGTPRMRQRADGAMGWSALATRAIGNSLALGDIRYHANQPIILYCARLDTDLRERMPD